jgi:signal peptidase II
MKITGLLLAFLTLIIDQISKYIIVKHYPFIKIEITSFFNLSLVYNKGLLNNLQYGNYIFCLTSSAIVCFLFKWLKDSNQKHEDIGLSFIIGGAIGNIIDRLIYPGVVDFLEFHWHEHYWPSFNIADSAICLGVCISLVFSIKWPLKKNNKLEK